MLLPALWSLLTADEGLKPLACSFAVGAALYAALRRAGGNVSLGGMTVREAILSVVVSWIVVSVIVGLPYIFSGAVSGILDAVFEGISGFTTTGASVITRFGDIPDSILLWRSFSQWLGGIGIVVLTLAVFPVSGAGMRLYKAEVSGPLHERLTPRIQQTAAFLCKTYLALTCAEFLALSAGGLGMFDSLTLSFATLATGGFSPYRDNVGHFAGSYVKWVTAFFLLLSASNLTFFHSIVDKKSRPALGENPELKFYAAVFAAAGVISSLLLYKYGVFSTVRESVSEGVFHAISMLSTCGFFTANHGDWPAPIRLLTLALMFCGGCSISTAGGITCVRVLVLVRYIEAEFTRKLHPRAIVPTRLGDSPLDTAVISSCFAYFTAYIAIFSVGFSLLCLFGLDLTEAIWSAAAALGNVGPSLGLSGSDTSYASLPDAVKIVYIILMLCGRLEIFTLLSIFTPRFWKQ
jgi:trk system potassium uptake protein TrkH